MQRIHERESWRRCRRRTNAIGVPSWSRYRRTTSDEHADRTPSVPPSRLAGSSWDNQLRGRIWQADRRVSVPPSQLGCSAWAIEAAWARLEAESRSQRTVAYHAARRDVPPYPNVSGGTPTRNAPAVLANESVSIPKAQRRGHTHRARVRRRRAHRAARPSPHVVPCHTACRFYSLECRIPPSAPPNTALQLTASRARSWLF